MSERDGGEPNEEREVKLRVASASEAARRLLDAGASSAGPRVAEVNSVHDDSAGTLRGGDRLLRVRSHERIDGEGETPPSLLTYKGPGRIEDGLRVREEIETEVADAARLREILERTGFAARVRYEKRRRPLAWGGASLAVDETPVGDFVEVEGTPDDVARCREALGLDPAATCTDSYLALWREAGGRGDMTFDRDDR